MWNLLVQLTPPFETPNAPSRILLFHAYPNEQGCTNRPVESGSVHTERSLFTIHQAISHWPEADLFNTMQENRRAEQINGISCFYYCRCISQKIIFLFFFFRYSLIQKKSVKLCSTTASSQQVLEFILARFLYVEFTSSPNGCVALLWSFQLPPNTPKSCTLASVKTVNGDVSA